MGKTGDTHTNMLQNASSKEFQWKIGENKKFIESRIYRILCKAITTYLSS
jgi:hypothetical protein